MSEANASEHQANGLMQHFYNVTEVDELERLMMVIARSSERAGHILYQPRFLPRMARHILEALLVTAYDSRTTKRAARNQIVTEIARKVRLNNLVKHPLEEGVENLIASVQDPSLRMYIEATTAYTISIVAAAQQTKNQQAEGGVT